MGIIKGPRSKYAHGPGKRDGCQPGSGESCDLVKTGAFLKNLIMEPGIIIERSPTNLVHTSWDYDTTNGRTLGEPMDFLEPSTGSEIHSNETVAILEAQTPRFTENSGASLTNRAFPVGSIGTTPRYPRRPER
jgi:hypothetical protein